MQTCACVCGLSRCFAGLQLSKLWIGFPQTLQNSVNSCENSCMFLQLIGQTKNVPFSSSSKHIYPIPMEISLRSNGGLSFLLSMDHYTLLDNRKRLRSKQLDLICKGHRMYCSSASRVFSLRSYRKLYSGFHEILKRFAELGKDQTIASKVIV